ncbi:hypothetical protein CICLE_v10017342mg [Citrus x clementina]|uniref:Uncharacterized protein n=2 Tax=Citrus TaxID=2706 RepID=V4UGU2_CITCL|nr:hypothetical protein CICLE_v10017342mg [Citrus x clementina]GAY54687.1 hypothetical protein CUMW_158700 [Citrus unshiu]
MMCFIRVSIVVIFLLIIVGTASNIGGCSGRPMRQLFNGFENRLPKEPVPPSGPSQCHNALSPYYQTADKFSSTASKVDDYIGCP